MKLSLHRTHCRSIKVKKWEENTNVSLTMHHILIVFNYISNFSSNMIMHTFRPFALKKTKKKLGCKAQKV